MQSAMHSSSSALGAALALALDLALLGRHKLGYQALLDQQLLELA